MGILLATPKHEQEAYNTSKDPVKKNKVQATQTVINKELEQMPTFSKSMFAEIPEYLQQVVAVATSEEEKDILLLGSLVAISACLPKISGIYDGKWVYANLFLFITGQAPAGKGRLVHCRQLVNPIHKELREEAKLHKQHFELEMVSTTLIKAKLKE